MESLINDYISCIGAKPTIPRDIIKSQVNGYTYVFNPFGHSGVIVLAGPALAIFSACEESASLADISQLVKKLGLSGKTMSKILEYLAMVEAIEIKPDNGTTKILEKQKKVKRFTIWLQITNNCNLNCVYCYIQPNPHFIDLETAKTAIEKTIVPAKASGFSEVVIKLAGGEPMLCWPLIKKLMSHAVEYAKGLDIKIRFHMLTNGTILPDDIFDYLESNILSLSFSVDGVGSVHNLQRPYRDKTGSFDTVNKNLQKLMDNGKRPYLLATITAYNIDSLIEFAQFCKKYGLSSRLGLYKYVSKHPSKLIPDNSHVILRLKELYLWMADNLPKQSLYDFHRLGEINLLSPKKKNCGIGINSATISCDGDISICQYDMGTKLGNVREDDVIKTIRSQSVYDIKLTEPKYIEECADCQWRFSCAGGCPLVNRLVNGKINSKTPYCEVFRQVMPLLLDLHAKQVISNISKERG